MYAKSSFIAILVLFIVIAVQGSAIPKDDEHSSKRTKEHHVSDHEHFDGDGHHNADYDHDAFLGEEEAKEFEKLTPEESSRRLGLIYDKIDKDNDGQVTKEELTEWIQYVQTKYMETDANRQWDELQIPAGNDKLSWAHYRFKSYGGLDNEDGERDDEFEEAVKMERRDKVRFEKADMDKDGQLNKKEFSMFVHPEEYKEMRDNVIDETLEDIDKDGDGFISMKEYIDDLWTPVAEGEKEPEWLERERNNFVKQRDADGDGKLNREEVLQWVMPDDYDHMIVEAKHLMREADGDKDGVLTKQEVLDKHDLFVGSQATDYGDALQRHDEF